MDHPTTIKESGRRLEVTVGRRLADRTVIRAVAAGSLALVLPACGADAPLSEDFRVEIDTVGGVEYVRAFGVPPILDVEPGVRIGAVGDAGEPGPDEFGMIRSVVADAEGAIYVADVQANEIRVFGRDGGHLRTIGRSGRGPGEFNALYTLAWVGDTLVTFDPNNARIGFLSPTGEWLGSTPYRALTGNPMFVRFYPTTAVEAYVLGVLPSDRGLERVYIRVTGTGLADTLVPPPLPDVGASSVIQCPHPGGGGISFFSTPFTPGYINEPAPGGVFATAWSADYRVAFVTAAGDTLRVVERDYRPHPVTDEEWEAGTADYRKFREEMPGARCEPSGPSRPAVKPAIRHLFFDAEGRLWVEWYAAGGFAYDIFGSDGRLIGTVDVPDRDERFPPYARGGRLYQVETDEFDVQYVREYVVELLPSGR